MGFNLFPKEFKFYDLFEKQNANLVASAESLAEVFKCFTDIARHCTRVSSIQKEGNVLCREIAKNLSLTFITPIDREDIHELSLAQEAVLAAMSAVSTRIGLYGFGEIRDAAAQLVGNLDAMVKETSAMLARFRSKKDVEAPAKNIEHLKLESEALLLVALGELYEDNVKAVSELLHVVKWSHVYDRIEEAINCTAHLARIIEGISLKYS